MTEAPTRPVADKPPGPRQVILDAISQLEAQGKVVTRQVLMKWTGYSYTKVDDHLKNLRDEGVVESPVSGVIQMVREVPATRPVSATFLGDGMVKLEIGEHVLDLTLLEAMLVGTALAGVSTRFGR